MVRRLYSVYLVDDEPLMIQNMIHALAWGENGFEVIGSNTSSTVALEEIKEKNPNLVFCDLKMPFMDGVALMKACREAEQNCEFIFLSAYGEFEASRRFFLMDGFDYLLKPLQPPEAEITLERLSRKLGAKNHLIPTTTFLATNTKAFDELIFYISLNYKQKHTLKSLSSQFNLAETYTGLKENCLIPPAQNFIAYLWI